MKAKLSIIVLILTVMIVAMVGCQNVIVHELEIRLAPIHDVKILVNMSLPEQIIVYIKGGLADSCTTFHEIETQRSGNTIYIEVTTERPADAVCAQVYSYFEKNVNLGSGFIRGESYIVDVNGVTRTFNYLQ